MRQDFKAVDPAHLCGGLLQLIACPRSQAHGGRHLVIAINDSKPVGLRGPGIGRCLRRGAWWFPARLGPPMAAVAVAVLLRGLAAAVTCTGLPAGAAASGGAHAIAAASVCSV